MTRDEKARAAAREAQRFLAAVKAWEARANGEREREYGALATREGGAMTRASLDLSRALADLRKP